VEAAARARESSGVLGVPRRFRSPPVWWLRASALLSAVALAPLDSRAQTPSPLDLTLLRPAFDGNPLNPPRFSRQRVDARDPNLLRFSEVANFDYQPGAGTGTTGFDSINANKRKPKGAPKGKPGAAAKPTSARPPTDASGRAETAPSLSAGGPAVRQPIGAGRLPQYRERRGAPSLNAYANAIVGEPPAGPLRRLPLLEDNLFDPVGINVGSFRLRPALEVIGGYDTGATRTTNAKPSWSTTVAPELLVNSNWARHELTASLRSSYIDYYSVPSLSRPAVDAKVTGRVDVTRDTRLNLEAGFVLGTDNPGSPNIQADLRRLPIFTTVAGAAAIAQRFNRLEVSLKGLADRTEYQRSSFIDGQTASNDDRNYDHYGSELRVSYELTPGVKPFVEIGADQRRHDLPIDRSGVQRDSDGRYAKAGTTFEWTRLLTGEMSLGYLTRNYKDPTLPDLGGLLVDGALIWSATPLTTFKLTGKTAVSETTLVGVSGIFSRDLGVEVAHAFRRWLTLTVKAGVGFDDYRGSTREDERYVASAAIAYALNRDIQLKGEVRQEWRHSNVPGSDYSATVALLGVRLQR
jgi:hypothetical protein